MVFIVLFIYNECIYWTSIAAEFIRLQVDQIYSLISRYLLLMGYPILNIIAFD